MPEEQDISEEQKLLDDAEEAMAIGDYHTARKLLVKARFLSTDGSKRKGLMDLQLVCERELNSMVDQEIVCANNCVSERKFKEAIIHLEQAFYVADSLGLLDKRSKIAYLLVDLFLGLDIKEKAAKYANLSGLIPVHELADNSTISYYEELLRPVHAPSIVQTRVYHGYDCLPPVEVTENVYRGPFPDQRILKRMSELGIKCLVTLCDEEDASRVVNNYCQQEGLDHYHIPISPLEGPSKEQTRQFLQIVERKSKLRLYIHCIHGRDRTGAMIAMLRLHQGWSFEDAFAEMNSFQFCTELAVLLETVRKFADENEFP